MNRIIAVHMSPDLENLQMVETTETGKIIVTMLDEIQQDDRMQRIWSDPNLTYQEKNRQAIALLKELFGKPLGTV